MENGLTLCVGSFVASSANDVLAIAKNHADKINYVHLRNIETYSSDGSFAESGHLRGDVDMVEAIRICLQEQRRRIGAGERGGTKKIITVRCEMPLFTHVRSTAKSSWDVLNTTV